MKKALTVKDVMSKEVISVYPDTTVLQAHEIITNNRFNGLPVIDQNNKLVGMVTQYDLLAKGSKVHLPTLQKLFAELPVYKKDYKKFKNEIYELSKLVVSEVMNPNPITLSEDASLQEMVDTFREHRDGGNPIPVIDKDKKVVGIISRSDALKLFYVVKLTQP